MPRVSPLLLLCAVLAACARGGDQAARPDPAAGPNPSAPVASAPGKSVFEHDAPPVAEVGNLCLFRTRKDPVMSGFVDRTGAAWEGEVRVRDLPSLDPKWFRPSDARMATVVARPRVDRFRVRIDDNCYDAARKVYYSCSKVLEADLSKVRGFARALSIGRARSLAIQLCEKKVIELVESSLEIKQDNADLRCRIVEQAFCELPPAPPPPPPPAPAKKS
jgi:hypothetical protein